MKHIYRFISVLLALMLTLTSLPIPILADMLKEAAAADAAEGEASSVETVEALSVDWEFQEETESSSDAVLASETEESTEGEETTLCGAVTDSAGEPLEGVSIAIYNLSKQTLLTQVTTDSSGNWTSPTGEIVVGDNCVVSYYKAGFAFATDTFRCTAQSGGTILDTAAAAVVEGLVCTEADYTYTITDDAATITGYTGTDSAIILPAELGGYPVTAIGSSAFKSNTALSTVWLSEAITTIGTYAFSGCTALTEIKFPNVLAKVDTCAFQNCSALTEASLPDSVSYTGSRLFENCPALAAFRYPLNWTTANGSTIPGLLNFSSITVPEGVTTIPASAFTSCYSLKTVELPSTLRVIENSAFSNCNALGSVNFPEHLEQIGNHAFSYTAITEADLPDTVTSIGDSAFKNCTALTHFSYPVGLASAGTEIWTDCTSLTEIIVPETITALPSKVFYNANQLKKVTLPDSVTAIPAKTFYGCKSLQSVDFSSSLQTIGESAFYGCTSLIALTLPDTVSSIGESSFYNCTALVTLNLSSALTEIPGYAFYNCTSLQEVHLPEGVTSVGRFAYQNCKGLTTVTFPKSLQTIEQYAFYDCESIQSLSFGSGLQDIATYAFYGCTSITELSFSEGLTNISSFAFYGCTGITDLPLPDSLSSIGSNAFEKCTGLTSLRYPTNWTTAGAYIFRGCTALKSITIPEGVTALPNNAFGFSSIETVALPSTLQSIGDNAFSYCASLPSIHIKEGVQTIGKGCFSYCTSLENIWLPDTVTEIQRGAFSNCTALGSIDLPFYVTALESSLFENCISLTAVTLPNKLKTIQSAAFKNCKNLQKLHLMDTVTSISDYAFTGATAMTFYCNLTSIAGIFAIDHKIPMVDLGERSPIETEQLDREKTSYKVNYDGVSATGYLSMTAQYAFKEITEISTSSLSFVIPTSTELVEHSLRVDGVLCTDYTLENSTLTVPLDSSNGTVRFMLKPLTYDRLATYAKIDYLQGTTKKTEYLDVIYIELPILTLESDPETASSTVEVSGVTAPGSKVDLYIAGSYQKTVTANKAGDYTATLTLPAPKNNKTYTIKAETTASDGSTITAKNTVKYHVSTPKVIEFIMEHNGCIYRDEAINGMRPIVSFAGGRSFRFTVRFNDNSLIENVYIVSTRNNVRKTMKATWNEEEQAYVASGWFDPKNKSYLPGIITVEYGRVREKISFTETNYDFTSQEAFDALPEPLKTAEVNVHGHTDTKIDATVTITQTDDQTQQPVQTQVHLSTEVTPLPPEMTEELAKERGYTELIDDYGNRVFAHEYESPDEYRIDIISFGVNQTISFILDKTLGGDMPASLIQTLISGDTTSPAYEQMYMDVQNSGALTDEEKEALLDQIERADRLNATIQCAKWMFTAISFVSWVVIPGAAPALNILMAIGGCIFDEIQAYTMYKTELAMYTTQVSHYNFRWAIDPSGNLYDLTTGAALLGATVSVYWVPYTETDTTYWDSPPPTDHYGVLWDASEYSQLNPLQTDQDGHYAWDVPEGWWRVRAECAGYETTWSDWVPVPPPQTEVHIGMQPIAINYDFQVETATATSASVSLSIDDSHQANACWYLAAYDAYGKMITVQTSNLTVSDTLQLSYDADDEVCELRAFATNTLTQEPLCNIWSYTF